MKVSWLLLSTVSAGGISTDPLDELLNMVRSADTLFGDPLLEYFRGRIEFWPKIRLIWLNRISSNAGRMRDSFERCGNADSDFNFPINVESPCSGMLQIFDGFSVWADTYLSECNGYKKHNHQRRRKEKWVTNFLRKVSGCNSVTSTTTAPETTTFINGPHYYHTLENDIVEWFNPISEEPLPGAEYISPTWTLGSTHRMSSICNADWVANDSAFSCEYFNGDGSRNCERWQSNSVNFFRWSTSTNNGLETWLNCPQCGCENNNLRKITDVINDRSIEEPNSTDNWLNSVKHN